MENNPFENKTPEENGQTQEQTQNQEPREETYRPQQENNWSSQSGSYREGQENRCNDTNPYQYNPGWYDEPQKPQNANGVATASLILGILSIVGVCCCAVPAVIFGIAGFITALVAGKHQGGLHGQALAGLILSFVGFALGMAGILLGAVYLYAMQTYAQNSSGQMSLNPEDFENFLEQFQNGNWMPR